MTVSLPLSIGFLPRSQQETLALLTAKAVDAVKPEIILCYGIRSVYGQDWGCFLEDSRVKDSYRLNVDLLIVIGDARGQNEQDISLNIEQQCKALADVHCITHKMHSVREGLDTGHSFYSTILYDGITLYGADKLAIQRGKEKVIKQPDGRIMEGIWSRWYGLGQNFYKGAIDSLAYNRPDLTAFLLHQATEQTCRALIRVFTGYRPNTHNLSRLLMMVESFARDITAIFPKVTKEEVEIYEILQRCYLDSRYKEDYNVPVATLKLLIERVGLLQSIANTLFEQKLALSKHPVEVEV